MTVASGQFMYAIVETGGKQYKAEKGETLLVDRLSAKEGDKVSLRAVMFRGGEEDHHVGAQDRHRAQDHDAQKHDKAQDFHSQARYQEGQLKWLIRRAS